MAPMATTNQPTTWVRLRGVADAWVELWHGRPVAISTKRYPGADALADVRALAKVRLHDAYGGHYKIGAWGERNHEGIVKAVVTNDVHRNPRRKKAAMKSTRKRVARRVRRNPTKRPYPYIALIVRTDAFPAGKGSRVHRVAAVTRRIKRVLRQSYPDARVSVSFNPRVRDDFTLSLYDSVPDPAGRYQNSTVDMPKARADAMAAHIQKRLTALQRMGAARSNPVGDVYLSLSVRPSVVERAGKTWQKLRNDLIKDLRKIEPGAEIRVSKNPNRHHDFELETGRIVGIGRVDPLPMEREARIRNAFDDRMTDLVYEGKL